MSNPWRGLIVVVLAVAVVAVISAKRHAAQTPAPSAAPSCSASASGSCSVPAPPAPAIPAEAPAPKETKADSPAARGATTQAAPSTPAGAVPAPAQAVAVQKAAPAPKPKALPQMIELGSETCTPCQMMQPILEELRKEYKGQLEVPFWDVRKHPGKATEYGIRVIPTQVFVGADGKEFFRHEGFFPKRDILAKFREHGVVLKGAK